MLIGLVLRMIKSIFQVTDGEWSTSKLEKQETQTSVALSSIEAEYITLAYATEEVTWL